MVATIRELAQNHDWVLIDLEGTAWDCSPGHSHGRTWY